jgi:autotransporter adhesin
VVTADGSVAVGVNTSVDSENSVAVGADASVAEGAEGGTALGQNARVETGATGSVALGQDSIADEAETVSVGSAVRQRRITNVADGINDTDAVNVKQYNELREEMQSGFDRLERKIEDVDIRLDKVGALTAAFSALVPNSRSSGNTQVSLGYGNYGSEHAVAGAVFRYIGNNTLVNAGVSVSSDEAAGRVGVTIGW